MNILIISSTFPYPLNSGDKIRNFNLIKRLSRNHKISLIALIESHHEKEFILELKKYCAVIETVLWKKRKESLHLPGIGIMRWLLSGQLLYSEPFFIKEMKEKIRQIVISQNFDIIQFEHSFMAPYIKAIPSLNNLKTILTFHNIGFIQFHRMFNLEINTHKKAYFFINWISLRIWEHRFAENFDRCITVSSIDKQVLNRLNPELNVSVIPNGVDIDNYNLLSIDPANKNILFVGKMDYQPNVDAALYFYKRILPNIKKQLPDTRFMIVGSDPYQKTKQLKKDKNIIATGYVEDVRPYYKKCAVAVVPLRAGGGTRLKILESMALGRPVVSTSIGCEGLKVKHQENILIADKPEEFARYVIELITNIKLRGQISTNARILVETTYSWDTIAEDLMQVYEEMVTRK